jgi:hypothetical protein
MSHVKNALEQKSDQRSVVNTNSTRGLSLKAVRVQAQKNTEAKPATTQLKSNAVATPFKIDNKEQPAETTIAATQFKLPDTAVPPVKKQHRINTPIQLKGNAGMPVIQRKIVDIWMPNAELPSLVGQADEEALRNAIEGYLQIPVGEGYETFAELAAKAGLQAEYEEITGNITMATVAQLQLLAVNINRILDEEAAEIASQVLTPEMEAKVKVMLARRMDFIEPASQSKFVTWQKQLESHYLAYRRGEKPKLNKAQAEAFAARIEALVYTPEEEVSYDVSWKTKALADDIVVDSAGAVVGATLSLPDPDPMVRQKIRRRLTVSKARHMWDFADAETTEPVNSLLPAKADLKSVETDVLELARDFKSRFIANGHKAAYEFTASSGRIYKVNKTTAEYPHSFPVRGGDVVPMNMKVYNFFYGVKAGLSVIARGDVAGVQKARELIATYDVGGDKAEIAAKMIGLGLGVMVQEAVLAAYEPAVAPDNQQERLLEKRKHTKPRKKAGDVRKKWNE